MTRRRLHAERVLQFDGHAGSIFSLERSSGPGRFFSGSDDRLVVEWDLVNPGKNRAVANLPVKAFALCHIEEHNILLAGNFNGGIHVIDLQAKKELKLLQLHQRTIFNISWNLHGQEFYALSGDGHCSVWDLGTFELKTVKKLSNRKLRSLDFRFGKNEAAIGCGDGTIRIMDLSNWEIIADLEGHDPDFSVNACTFHPNGRYLLSGSRDAHINIWDLQTGYELVERIAAHNYAIYSIVFSPDGEYFATGSMDKTIKVWNPEHFGLDLVISNEKQGGHSSSVNKLLWMDYENLLISTGDDRSIKVWQVQPATAPEPTS